MSFRRAKTAFIIALLTLLAARADATTSLCSITGQVLKPDNSPCANCQINFNPPNKNPQIPVGTTVPIYVQPVYTTTDANGNLAAISLIQGIVMVTTIQDPASGSYSAALPVIVPFTTGTTFTQLLGQNALTTGTTQVNGLSVGTRTLTPSGANCSAGVCTSLITDFMLMCDASTGNVEYDLPPSSGGGRWFDMVKVDSSTNSCTFKANGSDTVNGASIQAFSDQYDSLMVNDGQLTKWYGVGPTVFTSLTLNKLNPKNLDCTDRLGPFNGARNGEKNVQDCGAVGGNSWSMENTSCTSNGTNVLTCSGIASTHFAMGQHVAFRQGAPAPTAVSTPSLTITPTIYGSTYANRDGVFTSLNTGCQAFNPVCWGTKSTNQLFCSNVQTFEVGSNLLTIEGNTYQVDTEQGNGDYFLLHTNLLTQVTGRTLTDGVLNGTTTVTSATGAFTSEDVGRPITGAGIPTGDFIASVGGSTSITLNVAATGSGSGVTLYLNSEPVTGANCTTHRSYEAAYIYSNGAFGPLSACTTTTTASNRQNVYNITQVQAAADANSIGMAVYGAEGDSCAGATLQGIEIPTYTFNQQAHTGANAYLNDSWLMSGVAVGFPKQFPLKYTFHDVGRPYGSDGAFGTALPTSGQGIFTGTITAINGTSVTLSGTVANSVTANLIHDDGPIINAAIAAAYTAPVGQHPYFTGVYSPAGHYPIVTPIVMPGSGGSLHIYGDGSGGGNDANVSPTQWLWEGALGGTMLSLTQSNRPEIDHIFLASGSTMGVAIDHDGPNIAGEPSSAGHFHDMTIGLCNTCIRTANINTGNVEFDNITHTSIGFGGFDGLGDIRGEFGVFTNSSNSLGFTITDNDVYGDIALFFNVAGHHVTDVNFPSDGGIGMWISAYLSTPLTFEAPREEHLSRLVYSPMLAGGISGPIMSIKHTTLVATKFTPDCAFIEASGGGTLKVEGNRFGSVATDSVGRYQDTSVCPSGFIVMPEGQPASTLDSQDNTYDNISTPFGLLTSGTNLSFIADMYHLPTTVQALVMTTQITTPLTSQTIESGCPYTVSNIYGTDQATLGSIACDVPAGGTISFPITTGCCNVTVRWDFTVNGQYWCSLRSFYSNDGTSGNTAVLDTASDTQAFGCSNTKDHLGDFNFYYDTVGKQFTFQNNGGITAPTTWHSHTGAFPQ